MERPHPIPDGHPIDVALDKRDAELTRRRDAGIRCPFCKCTTIIVGQYSYNTQSYSDEDEWGSNSYGEGDVTIAARCANYNCEADLTKYMLRKGWEFAHDHEIPNRSHRRSNKKERRALPALDGDDNTLAAAVLDYTKALGRLLDEQDNRRDRRRR